MIEHPQVIEPELLRKYMERFVGFGSPSASIWFVGLEQGGGKDLKELDRRLSAWANQGSGAFADLREYCKSIDERRWHGESPRIQPTLGKLACVALALEGREPNTESVRRFQADSLGQNGGSTLIAELMPLPSRNLRQWIYANLEMPELETRDAYQANFVQKRTCLLRETIRQTAPRAVVFLGLLKVKTWQDIAGVVFKEPGAGGALWASHGPTDFVVIRHPTAFGSKNADFDEVGRALRALGPSAEPQTSIGRA